jgi:hypothetical protein
MSEIHYAQFQALNEEDPRITENEDTRITESDDIRVTELIDNNLAESTLVANANLLKFNSEQYIKIGDAWIRTSQVYVTVDGELRSPEEVYKNINNTWKRVL